MIGAWAQYWEESERGWGVRPDGVYLYPTKEAAETDTKKRLKAMRNAEAKLYVGIPDEYSRPAGAPKFVPVGAKLATEIKKKGYVYKDRL